MKLSYKLRHSIQITFSTPNTFASLMQIIPAQIHQTSNQTAVRCLNMNIQIIMTGLINPRSLSRNLNICFIPYANGQ